VNCEQRHLSLTLTSGRKNKYPYFMRLVIKVGSAVLTNENGLLNFEAVTRLVGQLSKLHQKGHEVILVTSGAIAAGVGRLGLSEKPTELRLKQAAAAIGQPTLMEAYQKAFSEYGIIPSQILLTREDLVNRERYLNIRNTLLTLLSLKSVPVINENDSVSTDEIQFGDNDNLSAIVAVKVEADKLIIFSDVKGLFEVDGDGNITDQMISEVENPSAELKKKTVGKRGSKLSVGGMATKLEAAKLATSAGIETWIGHGREPEIVEKILEGVPGVATRFKPKEKRLHSRDAWIAFGRTAQGSIVIDEGAERALIEMKKSLLPSGIKSVRGEFSVGDMVDIHSSNGAELGRGLVSFSSEDIKKIKGHHSREIAELLGRAASPEVIHRDNLVLL